MIPVSVLIHAALLEIVGKATIGAVVVHLMILDLASGLLLVLTVPLI